VRAIEVDGGTRGHMGPIAMTEVLQGWDEVGADGVVGPSGAALLGAMSRGRRVVGWEGLGGDGMDNPLSH
jgi:hypothetical protein